MFSFPTFHFVFILSVKLACCDVGKSVKLAEWFQILAGTEILPFGGKWGGLKKNQKVDSFIENVECSDEPNVSDNFYYENGKISLEGKFSGLGTLYIFDRLEGKVKRLY